MQHLKPNIMSNLELTPMRAVFLLIHAVEPALEEAYKELQNKEEGDPGYKYYMDQANEFKAVKLDLETYLKEQDRLREQELERGIEDMPGYYTT